MASLLGLSSSSTASAKVPLRENVPLGVREPFQVRFKPDELLEENEGVEVTYENSENNQNQTYEKSFEEMEAPALKIPFEEVPDHNVYGYNSNSNSNSNSNPNRRPRVRVAKRDGVLNPYNTHPSKVKMNNFLDARLYPYAQDAEAGYQVPKYVAKKEYQLWLKAVRNVEGWERFRREKPSYEKIDMSVTYIGYGIGTLYDEHGRPLLTDEERLARIQRIEQAQAYRKQMLQNRAHRIAQGKERGVRADDEDYRPRTFTRKMGARIAEGRMGLKLKQDEFAKKANIDLGTLRAIERGDHPFNSEDGVVKSIAKVLGWAGIRYEE